MTQELRLSSDTESRLKWQTGIFVYTNTARVENSNYWTTSGAPLFVSPTTRETEDYGLFGEATYAFTDATRLTFGARYDYTRVNTSQVYTFNANLLNNSTDPEQLGFPVNNVVYVVNENTDPSGLRTWRKGNYKVRFEHDLTPQNLIYAMVSTGFIPGDVSVSDGQGVQPYDAETLTAYEMGSKNRFLDDSLQLNGGVFFYDYDGYQVQVQPDPDVPSGLYTATVPARMQGLELEILYQLTPRDRVGLNYAFLESWYVDKPAQFAADVPWKHIAPSTGDMPAPVPHTVNANYEHIFDLPGGSILLARIDGIWTSAHRMQNPSPLLISRGATGYIYTGNDTVGFFADRGSSVRHGLYVVASAQRLARSRHHLSGSHPRQHQDRRAAAAGRWQRVGASAGARGRTQSRPFTRR